MKVRQCAKNYCNEPCSEDAQLCVKHQAKYDRLLKALSGRKERDDEEESLR